METLVQRARKISFAIKHKCVVTPKCGLKLVHIKIGLQRGSNCWLVKYSFHECELLPCHYIDEWVDDL